MPPHKSDSHPETDPSDVRQPQESSSNVWKNLFDFSRKRLGTRHHWLLLSLSVALFLSVLGLNFAHDRQAIRVRQLDRVRTQFQWLSHARTIVVNLQFHAFQNTTSGNDSMVEQALSQARTLRFQGDRIFPDDSIPFRDLLRDYDRLLTAETQTPVISPQNLTQIDRQLAQLLDRTQNQERQKTIALQKIQTVEQYLIWLCILLSGAIVVAVGRQMRRPPSPSIAELSRVVRKITRDANSDLRLPLPKEPDELRALVTDLNTLLDGVSEQTRDLKLAKEKADEANFAKSQFLANMSHELRTPLNAILGYSDMLQEDAREAGDRELMLDLEMIYAAGKHLLSLINDILDLSKIEAGKMELYLETFELKPTLDSVVSTIKPLVHQNRDRLEVYCEQNPIFIHADATKLRQILLNLLSNATKFTQKGTIVLTVKLEENVPFNGEPSTSHQNRICFWIRDTGIGISEDRQNQIFDAFTQAHACDNRKYGGTGLGLAISRHFCQMMGGDLQLVESRVGKGSVFKFWLPLPESETDGREIRDLPTVKPQGEICDLQ